MEMLKFKDGRDQLGNSGRKGLISIHSLQIHVSPSKQYREGKEFEKTKQVLGSGNSAGDIIIVKDKKTGLEHAQKTVSQFTCGPHHVQTCLWAYADCCEGPDQPVHLERKDVTLLIHRMI